MLDIPYRILAVLPDTETRRCLEFAVQRSQWRVEFVRGVPEAVERLREQPVPVVICQAEGVGDWRALLGNGPLPVVIMTSRLADEKLWQSVLQAGGYDVLALPFEKRELFQILSVAGSHWRHECLRHDALAHAVAV